MKSIFLLALTFGLVIGCTEDTVPTETLAKLDTVAPINNETRPSPDLEQALIKDTERAKVIDSRLYQNDQAQLSDMLRAPKSASTTETKEDMLPNLIDQAKKEKRVSLSASPTIKPGEKLLSAPSVNGAEISMEMKID